jgi:hypothetical protein
VQGFGRRLPFVFLNDVAHEFAANFPDFTAPASDILVALM